MLFTSMLMQKRKDSCRSHSRSAHSSEYGHQHPTSRSASVERHSPPPSPNGDGVSQSHQQKRMETLQRTLSASKTKSSLPIGLHPHLFPVLINELSSDRGGLCGRYGADLRSLDQQDDAMMEDSITDDEDDWSETSSANLSPPAFLNRSLEYGRSGTASPVIRQASWPEARPGSCKLPSINHLIRSRSPGLASGYDSYGSATVDRSEPSSPGSVAAEDVRCLRDRDLRRVKDLSPSPQYHSRFLADGFATRGCTSPSLIEDNFSHISIAEGHPHVTPSHTAQRAPLGPGGPRGTSAPGSPALRTAAPPPARKAHASAPGTTQFRVGAAPHSVKRMAVSDEREGSPPPADLVAAPRASTTLRIKDEWKHHAVTVQGPLDAVQFKCIWAQDGGRCCGYTAKRHLVKRHIETRHLQIKDHVCPLPQCGKAFPQRNSLQIHLNRHTGKKPHACKYQCGEAFNDPARRHKHMVDVHGYVPQGPRKRHRTTDSYAEPSEFEAIAPWTVQPGSPDDLSEDGSS